MELDFFAETLTKDDKMNDSIQCFIKKCGYGIFQENSVQLSHIAGISNLNNNFGLNQSNLNESGFKKTGNIPKLDLSKIHTINKINNSTLKNITTAIKE